LDIAFVDGGEFEDALYTVVDVVGDVGDVEVDAMDMLDDMDVMKLETVMDVSPRFRRRKKGRETVEKSPQSDNRLSLINLGKTQTSGILHGVRCAP
jgi:hypothetical protein